MIVFMEKETSVNVTGIIKRGQRRIGSKTAQAMCTCSHFRFGQHLIHKAREHPWCRIVVCTEEYLLIL
ncbi:1267_t:CDS:2 [Ambispora gerdemannii]|uniref:1267_t:CDS:1 n=1 Tax=Ambispora gerdemannii TaxID=144530 RepID=A0A9N9BGP1_9GLOM|nr:1267_t:CDS:2 [Ambispora gerdemannii]